MKTRSSWEKVVKIAGGTVAISILTFLTAFLSSARHSGPAEKTVGSASTQGAPGPRSAKEDPRWLSAYGQLPLSFEENQGQTAHEVRYVSHGSGYELFLTPQEAVLALRSKVPHDLSPRHRTATLRALRNAQRAGQLTALRMHLEGTNPDAQILGMDQLPGKANYFIGNDPKKWHTGVPSYARVKYTGIYPGVDLVFYGNQRQLEYDFVIAPGADPKAIVLDVEGARGMRIDSRGDLMLRIAGGEVELRKPVVYQSVKGERREVAGGYVLTGNHHVRFAVASYDRNEPLILDPVLIYSSYLGGGGTGDDASYKIAVDGSGDAFVAGQTFSTDFPAGTNGDGIAAPASNAGASFVAELNPAGTQLLYSAYLIGSSTSIGDGAFALALDPSGKVYVAGSTFATDFPTTTANAYNPGPLVSNPNGTVYLTKLDPTVNGSGSLVYSTYLAGTGGEYANAVAADATGNAYVVGLTDSGDYPTMNPFQAAPSNAFGYAFLTRIDTTQQKANSLIYSTYLGGNGKNEANLLNYSDQAWGVAADSSNNAYLVGTTSSTDSSFITTTTAYQTAPPAANVQASVFVTKIDTTKSGAASLDYSTYLAGSVADKGQDIALGPSNVAYVTGTTGSKDFPFPGATAGAFDTTGTAFVTLVDTTKAGSASVPYSTYLGGSGDDTGFGIRADASGIAYVAGTATSADFAGAGTLKMLGAFQPTLPNSNGSPFIAKLNPGGNGSADMLYATYFGGSGDGTDPDQGYGIAIDASNPPNAYLTGQTFSTNMPVLSSLPTGGSLKAPADAFVAKLALIPTLAVVPTSLSFGTQPVGVTSVPQPVTLTNNTGAATSFAGVSVSGGVPAAADADFVSPSNTCGTSIAAGTSCTIYVTFTPSAPASAETATLVITDGDVNSPQNVSLSGTGSASAPGVGLAPTSLTFSGQLLTTTSAAQSVTLTNTGAGALTINSIAGSGDFTATSTGTSACPISPGTLAAGANCTISVTFAPTAVGARTGTLTITDNAGGSPQTLNLTGTGWDFSLAATTALTVKDGKSGTFTVTMTPLGGFNQAVGLACTGAPKHATCTLNPTSVTAADGVTGQTSTATVATKGLLPPPPSVRRPPLSIPQIVPLLVALILVFCLLATRRVRTRLGVVTVILILMLLAGCGPSTPKGKYTLTITGTSGTVSKTAQVALTVD